MLKSAAQSGSPAKGNTLSDITGNERPNHSTLPIIHHSLSLFSITDNQPTSPIQRLTQISEADERRPKTVDVLAATKKKYKPVALKVKPIIGQLPDKFRIVRHIVGDPLVNIPTLPTIPPPFQPVGRYTQERKELFDKLNPGFLLPAK